MLLHCGLDGWVRDALVLVIEMMIIWWSLLHARAKCNPPSLILIFLEHHTTNQNVSLEGEEQKWKRKSDWIQFQVEKMEEKPANSNYLWNQQ